MLDSFIDEITPEDISDTSIETLGAPTITSPLAASGNYSCFVHDSDRVMAFLSEKNLRQIMEKREDEGRFSFELAGPRSKIYFDPVKTRCAIVTCGGLCPGINDVIRSIVLTLYYGYGVRNITGIRYGLRGFIPEYGLPVMDLTPDAVNSIHEQGGTVLGSSRGPQPVEEIVNALERMNINALFIIGGDGTFRAGAAIHEEIRKRNVKISIIAIPKTIDNDIYLVHKTFGFDTAVDVACHAIRSAHVEATGAPNCIGIVKLMGRYAGFIAAAATIALRDVNFCLIPESDFDLDGDNGFLAAVEKRIAERGHAVVVVAEGAGQKFFRDRTDRDLSGNIKPGDIGTYLRDRIKEHFSSRDKEIFVRYIDPSYIIRSVPANVDDRLYCGNLGQNAVHAAMAGKTAMMLSMWNSRFVHVPLREATQKSKQVNLKSRFWLSVLESTGQPPMKNS
jgi:6-phosphofructokinase 1